MSDHLTRLATITISRALAADYSRRKIPRPPFNQLSSAGTRTVTAPELRLLIADARAQLQRYRSGSDHMSPRTADMYRRFHQEWSEMEKKLPPDPDLTPAQRERMQYSGAIGLLCSLSTQLSNNGERIDNLNAIERAAHDYCTLTGWSYRRIGSRIEIMPPPAAKAAAG